MLPVSVGSCQLSGVTRAGREHHLVTGPSRRSVFSSKGVIYHSSTWDVGLLKTSRGFRSSFVSCMLWLFRMTVRPLHSQPARLSSIEGNRSKLNVWRLLQGLFPPPSTIRPQSAPNLLLFLSF